MITARGVGFVVTAIGLFVLGGATSVGWVRVVDAVLWGMVLLSLVLQRLSVVSLRATRRVVSAGPGGEATKPREDDEIDIALELRNGSFWPRYFLSVAYDFPHAEPGADTQRFFFANLNGHGIVRVTSRVRCYRRGLHRLGPVVVESRVPFGLFRTRRRVDAPLTVLVYPHVLPLERLALLEGAMGESPRPRLSRVGQEIAGSRRYAPGDPARHIHWRNSARLGELAVKEMEDTTDKSLTIVFQAARDQGAGRETTLEYSIKLAASLGVFAQASGQTVRLVAGHVEAEFSDPAGFLRELALLEAGESPPLAQLMARVDSSGPVVAFVAADDQEGAWVLIDLAGPNPSLAAVVLEGFDDGGGTSGMADIMRSAGVWTVVCRRGTLAETLGQLGWGPRHTAHAHTVPSQRSE